MEWIEKVESFLLGVISKVGLWITPLVPAYFVQRAMANHLGAPGAWGWIAAAALAYGAFWFLLRIFRNKFKSFLSRPVYVYLMRREDGIFKIGYTDDLARRKRDHEADYDLRFNFIMARKVSRGRFSERTALKLTLAYKHIEGRRKELRRMTWVQVIWFIVGFNWREFYEAKIN